ncbi:MAG: phenylacetate--CoA ligase family protein [Promethearchaeota archaeon]
MYLTKEFRLLYFKFLREYFYIKRNIYKSIQYNISIQKERLYRILNHAVQNVPYYQKIAHERNIELNKDNIFEDLKQFPILTKSLLRKNWKLLHIKLKNIDYTINTSGGTTGEPVKFIQSRKYNILNFCSKIIFNEIGDYYPGDKLVKLWGNEKDILEMTEGKFIAFVNKYFRNIIFLNSFKMSDKDIFRYINEINLKRPKVILAYVQSIYEVAKFIEYNKIYIHKLRSIITSAGVLTVEVRQFIEKIFNTNVYNRYGSREVSVIGSSCNEDSKIHIDMYKKYIEVLDENNTPVKEHKIGNIIITDLINYTMPLIRYQIGDRGSLDFSQCRCGRGLIRLDNIIGRVVDIFVNEKGERIDGEYFTHLFYFRDNLKKFQVIQENINLIRIKLVTINKLKLNESTVEDITKKIKIVMGQNCNVTFNYFNDIDASSSGKYRYTISKIKNN